MRWEGGDERRELSTHYSRSARREHIILTAVYEGERGHRRCAAMA
jgi:hypothetical protein